MSKEDDGVTALSAATESIDVISMSDGYINRLRGTINNALKNPLTAKPTNISTNASFMNCQMYGRAASPIPY